MGTYEYYVIAYFIIGITITVYYWLIKDKKIYNDLKKSNDYDDSNVIIYFLISIYLWPIVLFNNEYYYKNEKRRQNKLREF